MVRFDYVARARDGRTHRGVREAVNEGAVLQHLRETGLLALEIQVAASEDAQARGGIGVWRLFRPRRIDVEVELRQLAFLLQSGLPLLGSLRTCARQSARRTMREVWLATAGAVQSGSTLSHALRRHRCFPEIVTSLVAVGEQTGNLDIVLVRAADALERQRERTAAVITSLTYPAIVIVLATGTVAYMLVGLIPKLSRFLTSMGRRLPGPTQFLVDASAFVQIHARELAVGLLLCFGFACVAWLTPLRGSLVDPLLLRVPLVARVVRLAGTAVFAHTLSLLLMSGVRLTAALETASPLLPNRRLSRAVDRARERVLQGFGFSESLARETEAFGPLLISTIAVGESSGTLDEVLAHTAEFHDARLRALVKRLGAIIEPAIVIVIGGIVGFVYIAFFMAIYAVAGSAT